MNSSGLRTISNILGSFSDALASSCSLKILSGSNKISKNVGVLFSAFFLASLLQKIEMLKKRKTAFMLPFSRSKMQIPFSHHSFPSLRGAAKYICFRLNKQLLYTKLVFTIICIYPLKSCSAAINRRCPMSQQVQSVECSNVGKGKSFFPISTIPLPECHF
jgi:hypothetical protein